MTELLTALELGSLWYHVIVITSFWSLDEHTARNQTATPSVSTQSHPFETALNFHSAVISYSTKTSQAAPQNGGTINTSAKTHSSTSVQDVCSSPSDVCMWVGAVARWRYVVTFQGT